MAHRGPDDEGYVAFPHAAIGMRRLAIFDPAHGHQPMQSPGGRFTLVFNGAIYNFRALRAELADGWDFRTECDTEVLLAAFARWGAECMGRLRGMFAFAVWDEQEQTLFVARDAFGIKPLYYAQADGGFVFASELKALLASGRVGAEIDPESVRQYLAWFAVPAPRTIYREIFSLKPGECGTFRNGRLTLRTWWSFRGIVPTEKPCAHQEEFTRELRARLEDTIAAHLIADVPVGAFLSGGLDSAAVVGLMSRVSSTRLRTFSIDFAEAGYSEASAAAETAAHFGTEHQSVLLTGATVADDLDRLVEGLDHPSGDGINTYYASEAARAGGVTVALSGLGADELFGGYPSFRHVSQIGRWLPLWRAMPRSMQRLATDRLQSGSTRARKLGDVLSRAQTVHELAAEQRRVLSPTLSERLLAPEIARALGDRSHRHPALTELADELAGKNPLEIASGWELRSYMADVLLRDSDVMSMRHSLELRVPFVDRPFIEWLWQQPPRFKFDPRQPKSALHTALRDVLPPALERRPKWGFTLPFAIWMKRELRPFLEETFSTASLARTGLFYPAAVQEMWRGFLAGNDTREWSRVWSLALLIAFVNRPRHTACPAATAPAAISADAPGR